MSQNWNSGTFSKLQYHSTGRRAQLRTSHNTMALAPIPDLKVQYQQNSPSPQNYRSEQLRRTVSEPLLKSKLRRSVTSRKNPLHRNSSAPPTDCPSTPVAECTSVPGQSDSRLLVWDYGRGLSQKSKRHLDSAKIENRPMASPQQMYISHGQEAMVEAFPSTVQPVFFLNSTGFLQTPVLSSPHTPVQQVHMVMRQHRPLTRTQSQPLIQWDHYPETQHMYRSYSSRRHRRSRHIQEVLIQPRMHQALAGQQDQNKDEQPEREKATRREKWRCSCRDGDRPPVTLNSKIAVELVSSKECGQISSEQDKHLDQMSAQEMKAGSPLPLICIEPSPTTELHFTGLMYDSQMMKQRCSWDLSGLHPEYNNTVWTRLQDSGLSKQCKLIPARKATIEEIQVPQEIHPFPYGTNPLSRLHLNAARMAAGCVTELALRVALGELRNGFAIVKPHGHAMSNYEAVGFSSSVAIAAKQLQQRLCDKKILIVNWDVHHGNITQNIFYTDPKVLCISLHRCDLSSGGGEPTEVGSGEGKGFNVNVAWSSGLDPPIGDAEYLAAFRSVVIPIAEEFSPDVILVSSQFNAVKGHPTSKGGHSVSAKCFGVLTQKLMDLARGRVVLAVEGGHDLTPTCDASEACVNALLENKVESLSHDVLMQRPCAEAFKSLQTVLHIHRKYWSSLKSVDDMLSQSLLQAERRSSTDSDAALALASLSMTGPNTTRELDSDGLFSCRRIQNEPMEHDENETM